MNPAPAPPLYSDDAVARYQRHEELKRKGYLDPKGTPRPEDMMYVSGTNELPPPPLPPRTTVVRNTLAAPRQTSQNIMMPPSHLATVPEPQQAVPALPSTPTQGRPRRPEAQLRLTQAHPRPPRTVTQMPTTPTARARGSHSRPYPESPSAGTRRSTRPRQAPSIPSSPVVLNEGVYKVPLPRDTDPDWRLSAIIDEEPGLSLVPEAPLYEFIAQRVHLASYDISHYIHGFVYVQKAYFATEAHPPPFPARPQSLTEIMTQGGLLERLAIQQLKSWRDSVSLDLRRIVGNHAPSGVLVRASQVYIVCIRRRRLPNDGPPVWCYFPQLEVRL